MTKKTTTDQAYKRLYWNRPMSHLLGHFRRLQEALIQDHRNSEIVQELDFLTDQLLKTIGKTRGVRHIDDVSRFLQGLSRDRCDTSTVARLLQRLEVIRNHRLAGKPNPFFLPGGGAGNGTGRSNR